MSAPLSVALLHEGMLDKESRVVTTSLTLIDIHDIARSSTTYGVDILYIAHPNESMRKLAGAVQGHWETGFGSTYNPNRKEALRCTRVVNTLDDAISDVTVRHKLAPKIVATSAHPGGERVGFSDLRARLGSETTPHLLLFGTGWGMTPELLRRADLFLEPICGPTAYNHLSVRSACAIVLDRLLAPA